MWGATGPGRNRNQCISLGVTNTAGKTRDGLDMPKEEIMARKSRRYEKIKEEVNRRARGNSQRNSGCRLLGKI